MSKVPTIAQPSIVKPPIKRSHSKKLGMKDTTNTVVIDQSNTIMNSSTDDSTTGDDNNAGIVEELGHHGMIWKAQQREVLNEAAYLIWREEVVKRRRTSTPFNNNLLSVK